MSRTRRAAAAALLALLVGLGVAAAPAAGTATGLGETSVSPTNVSTGTTTTLDLSVNATGVNATDGTTGANVTVALPSALDLSGATAGGVGVAPNATGASASVDAAANEVVVSWDDDGGETSETVAVTVSVSGVAVDRTGEYDLTATVDADGDGATDARGSVGTVTASATEADRSVTAAGSILYLGEEDVDLTGVEGAAPAGESDRFYGVGGEAEGGRASATDAASVDVTLGAGFAPGTYAFDAGAGESALTVQRPNVSDVRLYPGTDTSGTDVDGSSVPTSVETLTVDPRFDFGASENATVVVEAEDGLDVTDELTADPTVSSSGETVALDVSDLDVGTYTVRVEGADDFDDVNGTATVRVREEARTVTLSRTRVTRGESSVVTVSGRPGAVRHVRVPAEALRDGESVTVPTAKAVFGAAEGLVLVDVGTDSLYAVVALDENGFARVELDTERLAESTHEVAVARNATAEVEASVPLTVTDRRVSVTPARTNLTVGETVTVSGTARGADDVKLYATAGGAYEPLYADAEADELAETGVAADGSWEVDLDTRRVLTVPGEYRIAAVANPGDDYLESTAAVDQSTLRGFDAFATTTVATTDPSPSASVSRTHIATTDEVRISGRAPGPAETVRVYVVSPRGAVDARDAAVAGDDGFDVEYDAFDAPGTYRALVVTTGRDGAFDYADGSDAAAVRSELTGAETPTEAVAVLRDAYGGAGVDDRIVALNVTATDPRVTVESVLRRDGELVVTGATNRENGTVVSLDLRDETRVVAVADTEVNATGRWRTTVDASGVDPGRYTLRAETAAAGDTRTVRLGGTPTADTTATPAPTEAPTQVTTAETAPPPTRTAAAGAAAAETGAATDRATRTAGRGDGFGAIAFLTAVASLAAFLAAGRRRRRRP